MCVSVCKARKHVQARVHRLASTNREDRSVLGGCNTAWLCRCCVSRTTRARWQVCGSAWIKTLATRQGPSNASRFKLFAKLPCNLQCPITGCVIVHAHFCQTRSRKREREGKGGRGRGRERERGRERGRKGCVSEGVCSHTHTHTHTHTTHTHTHPHTTDWTKAKSLRLPPSPSSSFGTPTHRPRGRCVSWIRLANAVPIRLSSLWAGTITLTQSSSILLPQPMPFP